MPGNLASPEIRSNVEYDSNQEKYIYSFSAQNQSDASKSLFAISITVNAEIDSVRGPNLEWRTGFIPRFSAVDWAHTRGPTTGILQDSSESGFIFHSTGLPVIAKGYASSASWTIFDDHGPSGEIRTLLDSLRQATRYITFESISAQSPPNPFDPLVFLDTLTTYPQQASDQSWISDSNITTEFESALIQARSELASGDSTDAGATLINLLDRIEEERDVTLTSETYALLKFNIEYLLGFLPNPAPDLSDFPAALTLSTDTATADFSGGSFTIDGGDHDTSGSPPGNGNPVHGVLTTTTSAQQAVLNALGNNQQDSITGTGPAPDVTQADLDFDPETLLTSLMALVTDTLTTSHTGTLGTLTQPIVAYAPNGISLTGNITGTGVLIVDGDFTEQGSADWTGLVIVRSTPTAPASFAMRGNVSVTGAVLLYDTHTQGTDLEITGSADLRYSEAMIDLLRDTLFPAN